jgi:hypothetical protein
MPSDWFEVEATELVSGSILREVADFWGEQVGDSDLAKA